MKRDSVGDNIVFIFSALAMLVILAGSCRGQAAAPVGPSQSHSGGGVTIKVTYLNPNSEERPRFLVLLNTHTIDLDDYDLKSLSVLRSDKGKISAPTEVKNEGGGHHRQVTIQFADPPGDSTSFDLVILNVAGVTERVFHFDRK